MILNAAKFAGDEDKLSAADDDQAYTAKMARRACDAFMDIQAGLGECIDPRSMTKTAFVYARKAK